MYSNKRDSMIVKYLQYIAFAVHSAMAVLTTILQYIIALAFFRFAVVDNLEDIEFDQDIMKHLEKCFFKKKMLLFLPNARYMVECDDCGD